MCSAQAAVALAVAAGALCSPAWGQRPDHEAARLRARLDSLAREWRRASALADALDSLALTRTPPGQDTVRAGALRIVADRSPLPLAEAAAVAWSVLDSVYGDEARSLERRPYVLVPIDPDTARPRPRPIPVSALAVPWDLGVLPLAQVLVSRAPLAPPDPDLTRWLGGSVTPLHRPDALRSSVYVQLVTAHSGAARRCFLGDLASCGDALALADPPDIALRWYDTPDQRRAVVIQRLAGLARGATERVFRACADGDDAACDGLLRSRPPEAVPPPLDQNARRTLVDLALRLGGRDAYRRLLADSTAPAAGRLARAARAPIDSLLEAWRAEVVAARPRRVALPTLGIPAVLAWVTVFAAMALGSSRWRIT